MDNLILFYDGCHKIYYADREDAATIDQMKEWGYTVIDGDFASNLRELWDTSCYLRFVQPADLDDLKPEVNQGQADGLRGFVGKLRQFYSEAVL